MAGQSLAGRRLKLDLRDLIAGTLFILVAAWFAGNAYFGLSLGSARDMGPGYFPLLVCAPLAAIGIAIVVRAIGRKTGDVQLVTWKALLLVLVAPAAFALAVKPLGFIAAIASIVLISAWASRKMTARLAIVLAAILTILCSVIFYSLLRMPVSLLGPWLRWW